MWPTQISEGCYAVFPYVPHAPKGSYIDLKALSHVWCLHIDGCEADGDPSELMVCDCNHKGMRDIRKALIGMRIGEKNVLRRDDVMSMASVCPCDHVRTLDMVLRNKAVPKTIYSVSNPPPDTSNVVLVRHAEPMLFSVPNADAKPNVFHRVVIHYEKELAFKCRSLTCRNNTLYCQHIVDLQEKYIQDLPYEKMQQQITKQTTEELTKYNVEKSETAHKRKRTTSTAKQYNTETVRTYIMGKKIHPES